MSLREHLHAFGAPLTFACAAVLAVSPAAATAAPASCADSALTPGAGDLPQVAVAVICLVNAERAHAGLPALALDAQLTRASQPMADLMVEQQFFAHASPDGRSPLDRIKVTGYLGRSDTWVVGENLAWGSGVLATPESIVNAWMNSPAHRANILARDYRDIGIGVALGAPVASQAGGATYVTDFGEHALVAPAAARLKVSAPRNVSSKRKLALTRGVTVRAKRALRRLGHLTKTLVTSASGTSVARTTRVTLT